jgi:hypothetical protein
MLCDDINVQSDGQIDRSTCRFFISKYSQGLNTPKVTYYFSKLLRVSFYIPKEIQALEIGEFWPNCQNDRHRPVGAGLCRSVPVGAGWCRLVPVGAGRDRSMPVLVFPVPDRCRSMPIDAL